MRATGALADDGPAVPASASGPATCAGPVRDAVGLGMLLVHNLFPEASILR